MHGPVFIPDTLGGFPLPKVTSAPNGCQIVCSKFFLTETVNYKYVTVAFFERTINTGNYSSLSNQKGANLCLKCTKIRLAAELRPDPLGELMRSPGPQATIGSLLLRGREGEGRKGPTYNWRERRGGTFF